MPEELLNKLIEYINARIALNNAKDSSDDGLIEQIQSDAIEQELRALVRSA